MLKNAFNALVKRIKLEILHWKMVKSDGFDFLKVKLLLNQMQTYYFLLDLVNECPYECPQGHSLSILYEENYSLKKAITSISNAINAQTFIKAYHFG